MKNICISVDAQVVLSWLLTEKIKAKCQYTRNRLKDIREIKEELRQKYKVDIYDKYVPSADNLADLLSCVITL